MEKIKYSGKLTIYEKEHNFEFDGKQLKVMLDDETETDKLLFDCDTNGAKSFSGGNSLPSEYISGYTIPDQTRIVFVVKTDGYGISNIFLISEKTDIYINVFRYVIVERTNRKSENTSISYKSNYFHHFLNLIPFYKMESNKEDQSIAKIIVNFEDIEKQESYFKINDRDFAARPNFSYSCGAGKFEFKPELTITTKGAIEVNEIWKMYNAFCKTIKFLFLRTNIYPDEFVINSGDKKYKIYEREWDVIKEHVENLQSPNIYHSVRWIRIYEKFGNIFRYFYEGKGEDILSSIYDCKANRYIYDKSSISLNAASFEHVFNEIYPSYDDTHETNAIIEIKKELEKHIKVSSGKKKSIYKGILRHLGKTTLQGKLLYSFENYSEAFDKYNSRNRKKPNYKNVSNICAKFRNDIDHGNVGICIDAEACESLIYLRLIPIVLYYHMFDLSNEQISEIICDLFAY